VPTPPGPCFCPVLKTPSAYKRPFHRTLGAFPIFALSPESNLQTAPQC